MRQFEKILLITTVCFITVFFLAASTKGGSWGTADFTGQKNEKANYAVENKNGDETHYVYVRTWNNGDCAGNGPDGVAYFTDVFTVSGYLNKSSIEIQFGDAFEADYGFDKHHCFVVSAQTTVWAYNSYSKAKVSRRKYIAEERSSDTEIRSYSFEYYEDE